MSECNDGPFSGSGVSEGKSRPGLDEQVCEALATHSQVDASQIGVAVDAATGDLILFGSVPTKEQRQLAQDCATAIRGVRVVYNRLAVGRHVNDASVLDGSRKNDESDDPLAPEPADPAG